MVAVAEKAKPNQSQDSDSQSASAWSYRLVRNAVFSVTGAFILVMGLFAWLEVFNTDNAANVTAALSSLFGIVGTLVGAYFGIKASSDAQDRSADTAQRAVTVQKETAEQAATHQKETAQQALADQKETAQQAVEKTAAAASGTSKRTGAATPVSVALATLIPIAGGAGLIVLRHYLKRM